MVVVSYLVHYNNLLQNATIIITKWDSFLLQNETVLQNATVIAKGDIYYTMRQYILVVKIDKNLIAIAGAI